MQAVTELYEQDPGVLGHGHQHFAHGRGLRRGPRVERDPLELGDAVHDLGHGGPETGLYLFQGDLRVFDRVVQQGGGQGYVVHAQTGQHGGHRNGMGDEGLTRAPELPVVGFFRGFVSL